MALVAAMAAADLIVVRLIIHPLPPYSSPYKPIFKRRVCGFTRP
jgi:hypothetical protein